MRAMTQSATRTARSVGWVAVALGAALALHGLAHLPGAVAAWGLGEGAESDTWLEVSGAAATLVGVLWCLGALGFVWAAVLVAWGRPARGVLAVVTTSSLALCAVQLPAAIVGLVIDAVILLVLVALVARERWRSRPPA